MDEIKASIAEYYDQLRGILDEIDELVENLDADEYFQLIVEDDAFCARNSWTEISSIFDGPDRLLTALRKKTEDSGFEWRTLQIILCNRHAGCSLVIGQAITEVDHKAVQGGLPVADRHGPFLRR